METLQSLQKQADQIPGRIEEHVQDYDDLSRSFKVLVSVKGIDLLSAGVMPPLLPSLGAD